MNVMEAIAAGLVGLAVVAFLLGPLTRGAAAVAGGSEDPEDPDDTPKGVALAALREIEFDRATGKLSDEDYAALKQKYTAEALAVLRAAEPSAPPASSSALPTANPDLDTVEARIADRVRQLQGGSVNCPDCGPRPEGDALYCSSCGRYQATDGCGECGAPLVQRSQICEQCGVAVAR
jgi:hypothetical protein